MAAETRWVIEIDWVRVPGRVRSQVYFLVGCKPGQMDENNLAVCEDIDDALKFDTKAGAEVVAFMVAGKVREHIVYH